MYIQQISYRYGKIDIDNDALIYHIFKPLIERHHGDLVRILRYIQKTKDRQSILVQRYHQYLKQHHKVSHLTTTNDILQLTHLTFLLNIPIIPEIIDYCNNIAQYNDQIQMMDTQYHMDVYFLSRFNNILKSIDVEEERTTIEDVRGAIKSNCLTVRMLNHCLNFNHHAFTQDEQKCINTVYQEESRWVAGDYEMASLDLRYNHVFTYDIPIYWTGWIHNDCRGVKVSQLARHFSVTYGPGALWDVYAHQNPHFVALFTELYGDALYRPSEMLHFLKTGIMNNSSQLEEEPLYLE